MKSIAELGTIVQVSPCDDINVYLGSSSKSIVDRRPFCFKVEERLEDGQVFYGLWGVVVSGHERFQNLICSIIIRMDGADWRKVSKCSARFKVGKTKVIRDHRFDFRHPDGTRILDFPYMSSIGEVQVLEKS